jgi:hypothetical protein
VKCKNVSLRLDVKSPTPHAIIVEKKSLSQPKDDREAKLAQALRANLRRRKAADRPPAKATDDECKG